ncbi:MAG: tetratricopeptide repeat protein [Verrucomicrobiota bacterium]
MSKHFSRQLDFYLWIGFWALIVALLTGAFLYQWNMTTAPFQVAAKPIFPVVDYHPQCGEFIERLEEATVDYLIESDHLSLLGQWQNSENDKTLLAALSSLADSDSRAARFRGMWDICQGEIESGIKWLALAAKGSDVEAAFLLSDLIEQQGQNFDLNPLDLNRWLDWAASENHSKALVLRSVQLVREGNLDRAARLMRRAADFGEADAMYHLALFHANATGVKLDPEQTFLWLRSAAARGHLQAMRALGICYEHGIGTGQSFSDAMRWNRNAAGFGNADAITWCEARGVSTKRGL